MAALGKSILRTHPRPAISFAAPLRRKPPPGFARQAPLTVPRRPVTYRRFNEPGPQSGTSVWASPGPSSYGGSSRFSNVSRWVPYAAGAGVVWIIFHLEQVPETGRWRYMDTSERYELEAGAQAYRQTLEQYGRQILPPNHPTSKYVGRVAERIIAASGLPRSSSSAGGESHGAGQGREGRTKVDWSIHVVDDPNIMNAFVVPGGKVFVFTGILPVCANEAGLAAVLSHEVSHQVARHTAERMSLMTVLFGLAGLAEWTFGGDFGPLYRGLLTYCLELPNSRSSEAEGAKAEAVHVVVDAADGPSRCSGSYRARHHEQGRS